MLPKDQWAQDAHRAKLGEGWYYIGHLNVGRGRVIVLRYGREVENGWDWVLVAYLRVCMLDCLIAACRPAGQQVDSQPWPHPTPWRWPWVLVSWLLVVGPWRVGLLAVWPAWCWGETMCMAGLYGRRNRGAMWHVCVAVAIVVIVMAALASWCGACCGAALLRCCGTARFAATSLCFTLGRMNSMMTRSWTWWSEDIPVSSTFHVHQCVCVSS